MEPAIQVQSQALLSRSPQAIAIDAGWGTGKSTFMALWAAYLQRDGVRVIQFNAWKSSLSDPLDALTREILHQFNVPESERQKSHRQLLGFVRDNAKYIRQGVKLMSLLSPDLAEAGQTVEPWVEGAQSVAGSLGSSNSKSNESQPKIDSPNAFTSALSAAAKTWSPDKPVVIMVDELDRCSPEYAVEMLQLLELIFYAENVVFVVSMNRAELVHSVRAFYGEKFDAEGYLERFFDNVFPLPSSKRSEYIASALESIRNDTIDTTRAEPFLNASELSLREIDRAIQQLEQIFELDHPDYPALGLLYLWISRTIAPTEYRQFISGYIPDKDLSDAIFSNGSCSDLRVEGQRTNNRSAMELEAMLIRGSCILNPRAMPHYSSDPEMRSELYTYHQRRPVANINVDDNISTDYSQIVLKYTEGLSSDSAFGNDPFQIVKYARLLDRDASPY